MIIVTDSPNQLHEGCKQQCTENPKMNCCQNCLCTDCFSQNANEISEQNANVIESRHQASVGLTLLYYVKRWAAHQPFIYQPTRVPDSVTLGCPAPRLGLDLASLSSALLRVAASLCSGSISVCSSRLDFEVQFPRFARTSTVPANPLVVLKYPIP